MPEDLMTLERDRAATAPEVSDDGRGDTRAPGGDPGGPPELRVKSVERVAVARFMGAEVLFEGGLVRAVCDRLDRLYRDRDLRIEMGRNARARALEFTWAAYAANVERILDDLMSKNRAGAS